MLTAILARLEAELRATTVFRAVNVRQSERPVYPEALVWLVRDRRVQDQPSTTRRLTWAVRMTSHGDDAPEILLPAIDTVRDRLSGLKLPGHGHLEIEVPEVELVEYTHPGPMIYVARVEMTVFPATFHLPAAP